MLPPIGNYLLTIWQIIATGKQFGKRNQKGVFWSVLVSKTCFCRNIIDKLVFIYRSRFIVFAFISE
jgi:hypothetical protein